MKIQSFAVRPVANMADDAEAFELTLLDGAAGDDGTLGVVMLQISGPIDPAAPLLVNARKRVLETGSASMLESFDWALEHGAIVSKPS